MNSPAETLPAIATPQALTVASIATVGGAMTREQILANRQLLLDVMRSAMKQGVHYGVIRGTPKPTLFKPGADLLLMLFCIDGEPSVEDLSTTDCIRYRVTLRGVHTPSARVIGHGIGEASTDEEKYRWKRALRREYESTPEDRRRLKFGWDNERREEYETQQVRTNPADTANTILKMALKRAKVELALTCTAASDVFTQDLEDIDEMLRESIIEGEVQEGTDPRPQTRGKPATQAPKATGNGNGRCTEKQAGMLRKKLDASGIPENNFFEKFSVTTIEELPFAKVDEALSWIAATVSG